MARFFDGASFITTSIGGLSTCDGGAITIMAIVKLSAIRGGVIEIRDSGGNAVASFNADTAPDSYYYSTSAGFRQMLAAATADNWHLTGVTKDNGTATPRGHKYVYDTNTWTHTDAAGTMGDSASTAGASGTVRLGRVLTAAGDQFDGDIAIMGVWNRVLTDAEIEQLAFSLQGWYASAPDALWLLDQSAVDQKILDLTGNGANETAITGTSVSTNSVPVFSYGAEIVDKQPTAAGGTTFTQTHTGSTTPTGSLAKQDQKPTTGSTTPTGAIAKQAQKTTAGSTTPTGALAKAISNLLSGGTTPTGALAKLISKALAGSTTPSGALANAVVKILALAGSTTPTGSLAKQVDKQTTGSTTPTSAVAKAISKATTGTTTPTGALLKLIGRVLAGSTTPSGAVATSLVGAASPTPAERTYTVPAESRAYTVEAESRTLTVPAESRVYTA